MISNALRRMMEEQGITLDDLAQSDGPGNYFAQQQQQSEMPQPRYDIAPMQQNTMRVENGPDAGSVTPLNFTGQRQGAGNGGFSLGDLNPSWAPQQQPQQQRIKVAGYGNNGIMSDIGETMGVVPQLDMTRPAVDTLKGKGYYGKDGAVYVKGQDGYTKILQGYDAAASMARNKFEQDRRAGEADITKTQAQTAEIGAPNFQLTPEGDVFNPKSGQITAQGVQPAKQARQQQTAAYQAGLKELGKDDNEIEAAYGMERDIKRWQELNARTETGPIAGRRLMSFNPDFQDLKAMESKLSMNNFKPGQGSMSNMERGLIRGSGPNTLNDNATNQDITNIMLGGVRNLQDRSNFRENYLQRKGNLLGAEQEWQKYLNDNPRYVEDPQSGRIVENPSRADWQTHFGGGDQRKQGGQRFDSLPNPAAYKGKRVQGPEGILVSDGTRWVRQ